MATTVTPTTGSPCGACKFLRRKCASDCVFAPYFCSDQGPARFAAIHKVFGASNVSKLLMRVPPAERYETVVTIAYEAQARIQDPVYGCVGHVFALQQQVAYLQAQIMQFKAQMLQNIENNHDQQIYQWQAKDDDDHMVGIQSHFQGDSYQTTNGGNINSFSSHDQSMSNDSMESLDGIYGMHEIQSNRSDCYERKFCGNMSELQALAIRMMRN
ncbi:LOB domain-containing protein 16-like [Impatiens glandulifera]|uniref:LOB domain-containing protein 16-like n=1 Tax=Impatiens glandulifera TaxID=253017 RepID=UPI001FB0C7F9|nr:LOB domain-containing protein 16-like [Impatiens glandulifera]